MSEDDAPRRQDGGAIFDALTAVEGPIEREQPKEQQERDWSLWDQSDEALARAYADAAEEMRQDPLFDVDVSHGLEPEDPPWT